MRVFDDLSAQLHRAELWVPLIKSGVRVVLTVFGAWLVTRIASSLLRRLRLYAASVMERHGGGSDPEVEKERRPLLRSSVY